MKKILSILTLFCLASFAKAGDIITFEFSALAGSEISAPSASNDPLLTPSVITRGAGLTAAGNGQRFNATAWTTTNDLPTAIANDDYMEFSVTNTGVNQFSITNLIILAQRSNTGPTNWAVRGSHDGFATDLGTFMLPGATTTTNSFDVSGVAALQNRNTPVTFRVYGFSANSAAGSAGIGDSPTAGDNDLIIQGFTTPMGGGGSTNSVTIATTANASELGTNGVFTLTSTGTNFPITVTYTVSGTATLTNDYDFLAPATSNSVVMTSSPTTIEIVPVNDNDTNEIDPESVILTLDASGTGWTSGVPNSAQVDIFAGAVIPPNTNGGNTNVTDLEGFSIILKKPKIGKTIKFKTAKGFPVKLFVVTASNTVSSVAYAAMVAGNTNDTNNNTNAITFITAGKLKPITKGKKFKQNIKAMAKSTKTTKAGVNIPVGTASIQFIVRVNGTSGTNTGSAYFTNTFSTIVK
ncbi:MAG: hypothetical protein K1X66_04540 [Verrucomicrobiae bacterium]|nr:hypothetical protein [Verrucomicrobiae bacterium]